MVMMADGFGRYEDLGTIASGGMATVHLGRAVGAGGFERLVAIKVMHPHIAEDENFRAMFLDEARLAARIRHPNVVGVLDVQRKGEQLFLVMEYVDGPSLHQLRRNFRKRNTMLPVGMTLRIFVDALTGLHAAHELEDADGKLLNLIHRDVTPQNILVGRDGVSRITDFGVARAESRITSTRGAQLKGKIAYMPPEQLRNEPLDRRADIYAAGCALWEALAGQRLYKADSEAAIVHMVIEGAKLGPRRHNDEVAPELDYVVMRALAVDREVRYPDAATFADAIEAAAKECGLEIPATRQVAKFIRKLPDLEGVGQPTSQPSMNTSLQGIDDIPPLTHQALMDHRAVAPPVDASHPKSGTTTNAVVPAAMPQPERSRRKMIATVAAAMLASAGLTYAMLSQHRTTADDEPDPPTAAAAPAEPSSPVVVGDTADPTSPEPEPKPEPEAEPAPEEAPEDEAATEEPPDTPAEDETEDEDEAPKPPRPPSATKPDKPYKPVAKDSPPPTGHKGPGYNPTEL
jgi:eukaryotic-like serine/threonine-protein kinase